MSMQFFQGVVSTQRTRSDINNPLKHIENDMFKGILKKCDHISKFLANEKAISVSSAFFKENE